MPKFLSEEWVEAIVAGLNASDELRDIDLVLEQVVGEVRYWTRSSNGTVDGGLGASPVSPDLTISQDYETATAISRGELIPQAAFMQGKLKITGNMGKLLHNQAAIQALSPVMSKVETEY